MRSKWVEEERVGGTGGEELYRHNNMHLRVGLGRQES